MAFRQHRHNTSTITQILDGLACAVVDAYEGKPMAPDKGLIKNIQLQRDALYPKLANVPVEERRLSLFNRMLRAFGRFGSIDVPNKKP